VTIRNIGTVATGALSSALSGQNADSFTLSPAATVNSINTNANGSFTVRPKASLTAGIYNATITVSNANVPAQTMTVSFTVNPIIVTLSPVNIAFNNVNPGYGNQPVQTVTVKNTGTAASGILNIILSGPNVSAFTLSKTSQASLGGNASGTFTVVPKIGLVSGTYTATVTVSNANTLQPASANLSFKVN
jgi:hypothetical protein